MKIIFVKVLLFLKFCQVAEPQTLTHNSATYVTNSKCRLTGIVDDEVKKSNIWGRMAAKRNSRTCEGL
jgi:hypothetical protein